MLSIATINVQNKYKLKKYNGLIQNEDHIEMLFDLIQKYQLDIIGLQEVNQRYCERLIKRLPKNYYYYGKFRYPKSMVTRYVYPFSTFNESVPIITNQKVLRTNTKILPWFSSYVPRIVTIMEVETEELGPIAILNTHLDFMKNKTKVKQLHKLSQIIREIPKPIILMGDFNMTLKNDDFRWFIKELEKYNINHIDVGEKTFKKAKSNLAIDHIFLSSCFQVQEFILEKDENHQNFSDHYPVIVKLSLGFPKK